MVYFLLKYIYIYMLYIYIYSIYLVRFSINKMILERILRKLARLSTHLLASHIHAR